MLEFCFVKKAGKMIAQAIKDSLDDTVSGGDRWHMSRWENPFYRVKSKTAHLKTIDYN